MDDGDDDHHDDAVDDEYSNDDDDDVDDDDDDADADDDDDNDDDDDDKVMFHVAPMKSQYALMACSTVSTTPCCICPTVKDRRAPPSSCILHSTSLILHPSHGFLILPPAMNQCPIRKHVFPCFLVESATHFLNFAFAFQARHPPPQVRKQIFFNPMLKPPHPPFQGADLFQRGTGTGVFFHVYLVHCLGHFFVGNIS